MKDRREAPRIPLDAPCLLTLLVNGGRGRPAMAVDVSRSGVQLALPASPGSPEFAPGTLVTLKDIPIPLYDLLEGAHGDIAWVGIRCCGVRLDRELTIDSTVMADLVRL